jgi:hypothetical protein
VRDVCGASAPPGTGNGGSIDARGLLIRRSLSGGTHEQKTRDLPLVQAARLSSVNHAWPHRHLRAPAQAPAVEEAGGNRCRARRLTSGAKAAGRRPDKSATHCGGVSSWSATELPRGYRRNAHRSAETIRRLDRGAASLVFAGIRGFNRSRWSERSFWHMRLSAY